jgi:outer membrane protein OmpA-like peptidoglycan-associated protein
MSLISRGLPELASQTNDELAKNLGSDAEENRRVEIRSDDWDIIKPVLEEDTLVVANYPLVNFHIDISCPDSVKKMLPDRVKSWLLVLRQKDSIIVRERGKIDNLDYPWLVEFSPPHTDAKIEATLDVEVDDNEHIIVRDSLPVEYVSIVQKRSQGRVDTEQSAFRLIDFEFGNFNVTARHKRIISEYIRPALSNRSTVRIFGYTDALGAEQVNVRLSRLRAENVSEQINLGKRTVSGIGSGVLLYPNQTPEGRMYSRTVEIRSETPISE